MAKKIKFDPFKNLVLDEYEQEIEDGIPDDVVLTPPSPARIVMLQKAAENTLKEIEIQTLILGLQRPPFAISKPRLPSLVYHTRP